MNQSKRNPGRDHAEEKKLGAILSGWFKRKSGGTAGGNFIRSMIRTFTPMNLGNAIVENFDPVPE